MSEFISEKRVEKIEDNLGRLFEQLHELTAIIKKLNQEIPEIKNNIKELNEKIFSFTIETQTLKNKISDIEKLKYLELEVKVIKLETEQNKKTIDNISNNISLIRDNVKEVQEAMAIIKNIRENNTKTIMLAISLASIATAIINMIYNLLR
ncbi:MAG: hypothetical protein QXX30_00175 [Candidatus Aenigmatarchaeota archaeon]